ncbi:transcriptional regulator, LacI family [Caldicellulosiruptor owensensis OL]|uniref:Transcriptional regulator, LacI family n=1 Tax=Caldicellulosiruptor owensensis (strain ATCC 700167 / DSM 13100 / OL) TaxID=632518 RepID=E4Q3X9_CALOW|nr:substrate-binding domain-containing protein [Caldicellulosiruptor owensensis]ADQ04014.1 transcriptional regulator, LacI family [Caldicellulosiruptor owensensis OL]
MPSIEDVAKRAGVSKATVSRVINGTANVSEKKKKAVLEAIKALNYTPNVTAKNLARRKTDTIGIIIQQLSSWFYSEVVGLLNQYITQRGYGAIFCQLIDNIDYFKFLVGRVDGVIVFGYKTINKQALKLLHANNVPVVLAENNTEFPNVPRVNVNNLQGGYIATKYLIEKGCRKIVHISGPLESFESIARYEGYKAALRDFGVDFDEELLIEGDFMFQKAYESIKKLLQNKKIGGIFAANDLMAYASMYALEEMGISVPEDVKVVGFDDVDLVGLQLSKMPRLTTVRQPIDLMAKTACDILFEKINDPAKEFESEYILDTQLIIRQSA